MTKRKTQQKGEGEGGGEEEEDDSQADQMNEHIPTDHKETKAKIK